MRYEVRDATGPGWEWLPDWCVVDTEEQIRVAAFNDEDLAQTRCDELNRATEAGSA